MSAPSPGSSAPARPRRIDGSMSLLVDITQNSLDAAYAERAARKLEQPSSPAAPGAGRTARPLPRRLVGVALLVGVGLLTGTVVAQVRERADDSRGLRAELFEKVEERTAETDELVARADALREDVDATRAAALGADEAGQAAAEAVAAVALAAGVVPVVGPGIVVVVGDAPVEDGQLPETELRWGSTGPSRVLDRDLQDVVNGVWAAGAEAIAVNGIRLTSRTAIRSAGEAILVDFRPLSPPYVVQAIGDPADLEVGFLDGAAGRRFTTYTSLYGLTLEVSRSDELELPASGEPDLVMATPDPVPEGPS